VAGAEEIGDNEILLRRIPPGTPWLAEGPRITSANFGLKPGETGVSVSRESITSPSHLLALAEDSTGYRVAAIKAGLVRGLGLEVVAKPTPEDPGHAEIVPRECNLRQRVRKKLARACRLLPEQECRG